jgi:C-terminal processing protease CtpA/Prc
MAQTDKDVPVFRSITSRIAYLRVPSVSKPDVDLTLELEKTVQGRRHDEDLLIVDLRGNGGGDMRIQAVGNWARLRNVGGSTHLGASCLYPALRWGYTQISSSGLKPPVSKGRTASLQNSLDALFHEDAAGCPAKFNDSPSKWSFNDHKYPSKPAGKTRVLALVDDFCGSDCEGAVLWLSAIPGTVVAGVNTFGVAQYIQPGYFVLPNTRLPFRIALGTTDQYGDGRSFDGYGFDVDVVLAQKKDNTPEAILSLANRLLAK